nr:hypothetical protein [uncultured Pseudomonas sp.]
MAANPLKKLDGMEREFVSGVLERRPDERAIGYTVTFKLILDFTHFKHMANAYSPNYLEVSTNSIRPELEGLAYHSSYNLIGKPDEKIVNSAMLFERFTHLEDYMDGWIYDEMERRYSKPQFTIEGDALFITARQDFRWLDPARQIEIKDLAIIPFKWGLTLIEQRVKVSWGKPDIRTPEEIVTFMYTQTEFVDIEGVFVLKGSRYINGKALSFGVIAPEQVLTA